MLPPLIVPYFLKTIISSRKATRDYLSQGETDAED